MNSTRHPRPSDESAPALLPLQASLPLLGIAAWSGTGKTTLLEALLPRLAERGLRVAVIKHAHHTFDVDQPGKDSHRLRQAGAAPMLVASRARLALMMETPDQQEPDLAELVALVATQRPDLVLVEGFKAWPLPKLELHRPALGKPLRVVEDPWVKAVASDAPLALPEGVEALDLNDLAALADWIAAWPARWPRERRPRALDPAQGVTSP
ncbi:MAG: molybdopterin-guanine dinucleotide biosynthesis protein B [Halomonas sp.]|uniref:molybdopterin-guanine dinucleotide biosynthesis protein B n=1 Tax=Halomonas sp. TaxID=1486246 RepID=UPI0019E60BA4|nr:molybdopterin-guanine dinucleotide biosynthesis protein B [Halomonas sp.]MBE0490115.1 molybdopterin-guanine dinucleotide biosynthesis protein B [Halomonas sp.]